MIKFPTNIASACKLLFQYKPLKTLRFEKEFQASKLIGLALCSQVWRSCITFQCVNFYYRVALDTIGPLLETKRRNKYLLVVIDHYFKLVEAKAMANHDAVTIVEFLEFEVICRHRVHKYLLIDNGFEQAGNFFALFEN